MPFSRRFCSVSPGCLGGRKVEIVKTHTPLKRNRCFYNRMSLNMFFHFLFFSHAPMGGQSGHKEGPGGSKKEPGDTKGCPKGVQGLPREAKGSPNGPPESPLGALSHTPALSHTHTGAHTSTHTSTHTLTHTHTHTYTHTHTRTPAYTPIS